MGADHRPEVFPTFVCDELTRFDELRDRDQPGPAVIVGQNCARAAKHHGSYGGQHQVTERFHIVIVFRFCGRNQLGLIPDGSVYSNGRAR